MFKVLMLAIFLNLAPLSAFALAEGKADLKFLDDPHRSFELERNGDVITGHIWNFGGNGTIHGTVELKRVAGKWEGRLGVYCVSSGAPIMKSAVKGKLQIKTIGHGLQYLSMQRKGNELRINGVLNHNFELLSGGLLDEGDEIASHTNYLSVSLDRKELGRYRGWTVIQTGGIPLSVETELNSFGTLSPQFLAKEDPSLFALLYVMIFHLRL